MLYFGLENDIDYVVHKGVKIYRKDLTRFWKRVDVKLSDECWHWKGRIVSSKNGYGLFDISGFTPDGQRRRVTTEAHRFITLVKHKEIPSGMVAAHNCNNNMCVNPNHLSLLTNEENLKQSAKDRLHIIPAEERSKLKHLSQEQITSILEQLWEITVNNNINKLTLIRLLERNTLPKCEYYAW